MVVGALVGRCAAAAALALLIYEIVAKLTFEDNYYFTHDNLMIANTVVGSLCLAALFAAGAALAWRVAQVNRAGKTWWRRQRRVVSFMATQLLVQLVNATFFLAPNAYYLANRDSCPWFLLPVNVFGSIRWTCWAALFFLLVAQAHCLLPAHVILTHPLMKPLVWAFAKRWPPPPPQEGLMGYDLPFWVLLPELLLLWLPAQAAVTILLVWTTGGIVRLDANCQTHKDRRIYYAITSTVAGVFLIMIGTYFLFMYLARRELAKLPYSKYRAPNMGLKLQVHIQLVMAAISFLCITFMWYIHLGNCNSYVLVWFGMLPMQLTMTSLAVISCVMVTPVDPSPRQLYHHQCLQEVAWREGDAEAAREEEAAMKAASAKWLLAGGAAGYQGGAVAAAAAAAGAPVRAAAAALAGEGEPSGSQGLEQGDQMEPMFCFETALKALYLSNLMYYHEEEESAAFTMETALELYNLQHFELLWQKEPCDTKCLLAWGDGTIVVGFRGTASLANVLADIKVWRAVHPPKRGSYWLSRRPMVHKGFLDAYTAGGINQRLLQRLREIMRAEGHTSSHNMGSCGNVGKDGWEEGSREMSGSNDDVEEGKGVSASEGAGGKRPRRWRVLCSGHSLGGALATLASYDVAKEAERLRSEGLDVQVQLYTFGAPRPGNHAFARDFLRMVQDAWDVIHSDDAVAKGGKFVMLYKRAANRVLVTAEGDILPRPSFLESSLQRGPGHSIKLHLLGAYARSFAAVIRGQFESKAQGEASRQALRALLGDKYAQEMLGSLLSFGKQAPSSRCQRSEPSQLSTNLGSKELGFDEALDPSCSSPCPQATLERKAAAGAESAPAARVATDMLPGWPQTERQQERPQEQQPSWEAVGQVTAAPVAEQQRMDGEVAGLGPMPSIEGSGDMHVASKGGR
ncbi:hypothetical protein N2152v2_003101 [Parachlorella kessleri]